MPQSKVFSPQSTVHSPQSAGLWSTGQNTKATTGAGSGGVGHSKGLRAGRRGSWIPGGRLERRVLGRGANFALVFGAAAELELRLAPVALG